MKLRITIDIFSGRPNPVIELTGKEAERILRHLRPGKKLRRTEIVKTPPSILGYRGLIMEQVGAGKGLPKTFRLIHGDLFGAQLSHRAEDEEFEHFLLSTRALTKKLKLGNRLLEFIKKQVERSREVRTAYEEEHEEHHEEKHRCECAPLYEPTWWNDGGPKQFGNNCYNYATNYRSDTFAQPGLAAGAMYTSLTCSSVRPAAVKDDLIDSPGAKNKCPKEGHLVALVVAPGSDFHWYRKGRNGYWTHKPGGTQATKVDNSGHLIPDPRSADRGPYTDFCTFMVVMHGHIKIR